VNRISREEVRALLDDVGGVVLVEALPPPHVEAEHIPGAVNVPEVTAETAAAVVPDRAATVVTQGVREHRGLIWIGAGVAALGLYGFVATLQPDPNFGRILAADGGIFVAGSLAWGMVVDKFRPDRYDIAGAVVSLVGVGIIMYAPRG
jgi:small multidrug resistance family-3 protein